ncbi:MAG: ASCH domain-containing protein [Phycisphaerae bacterium]|jgi:predicted transcriptional regulator
MRRIIEPLKTHLVILKKQYLDKILDGSKTIELRLTKMPIPPFKTIAIGDKLLLKESSGPVCAVAQVSAVAEFRDLTPAKIAKIKAEFNAQILGEDEYWKFKSDSKFAVLVWLKNVRKIKPVRIEKKDWRAWVVLTEKENYGLFKKLSSGDIID